MVHINKEILIVVYLGLGFCFLQVAFITIFNVQEFIFRSAELEDPKFTVSSYYSWCCQFLATSVTCIFSATVTNICGPRVTLSIGGIFHLIFNLQFLFLNEYLIYIGNVLRGIANALTWTAAGRYLTENSQKENIVRNSGIYLIFVQLNRLFGNSYVLARFDEHFGYKERMEFYGVMAVFCLMACIVFATLPLALYNNPIKANLKESLIKSAKHFIDKNNLYLLVHYMFTGSQFSFGSGIYSNCLGFTTSFTLAPMTRMSISGLSNGIGGIVGGFLLGLIGKRIKVKGTVIILCFLLQIVNMVLMCLNLPNNCPIAPTNDQGFITNNYVAFTCAFNFGFLDTVVYSMTASLFACIFKETISEAHATLRTMLGVATAILFTLTPFIKLYGVVSFLMVLNLASVISFYCVEKRYLASERRRTNSIKSDTINIILKDESERTLVVESNKENSK